MADSEWPFDAAPAGATATTQVILARRSVRDLYDDRAVPSAIVEEIIRCGLAAPSSKNARPWRLHVVSDREVLRTLADAAANAEGADCYVPRDPITGLIRTDWPSSVAESAAVLRTVPTAIFVESLGVFSKGRATLASVPTAHLRGSLVAFGFEMIGIGAAVMNMWIAANALGVQGVFMGDICIAEKIIAARLNFTCDLVGVLAIGYSQAPPSPGRLHYDVSDHTRVVWHTHSDR